MKKILGGVYFLYNKGELVYIGKSNNIFFRIGTHIHEDLKEFDEWKYHEIEDEEERTRTEAYLISIYKPKYNKQIIDVDYHYVVEGEHTNSLQNMKEYEDLYWYVDVDWICEYLGLCIADCNYGVFELMADGLISKENIVFSSTGKYKINRKWVMDNWNNIIQKIVEKRCK